MYAVIQTGGKQYRVREGDRIAVEKLEEKVGNPLTITEVLALGGNGGFRVGTPTVAGAKVETEVAEQLRGEKILVFKKKRRKGYKRKQGHRQFYTVLTVKKIVGSAEQSADK